MTHLVRMTLSSRAVSHMTAPLRRHIYYKHSNFNYGGRYQENIKSIERFRALSMRSTTLFVQNNSRGSLWTSSLRQGIHTSESKKALPPLLMLLMRPLTKFTAVIFGRIARLLWRSLPQSKKDLLIQKLNRNRLFLFACLAPASVGSCYYFYISHIDVNPITRRERFIAFSADQMKQLADMTQETVLAEYKEFILPPSHPHYKRVVRVANNLLTANRDLPGIEDHDWSIIILDHPLIKNCFVLANGSVFVFTGMLSICNNDDQLGIILAHEFSHAILQHMAEELSSIHLMAYILFIPLVVVWALLPTLGAIIIHWLSNGLTDLLIHLPFSRNKESEADEMGLLLAAKACLDVREASAFWEKMKILSDENSEVNLEWLSTHPSYETRHQFLEGLIPVAVKVRDDCKCPRLSLNDPRHLVATILKAPQNVPVNNSKTIG